MQTDYSMENKYKAVIAMTSWADRIDGLVNVLKSIVSVTNSDYKIVITLSKEEFQNGNESIPSSLVDYCSNNDIDILWIYRNVRPFKKLLFAMYKYPNLPIIGCDDDFIYKNNIFEKLYEEWVKDKKCAVSISNRIFAVIDNVDVYTPHGQGTIYPPSSILGLLGYIENQKIIDTNNDDSLYGCYMALNDIKLKYLNIEISDYADTFNEISPLTNKVKNNSDFIKDKNIIMNELKNSAPDGISICISAYKATQYITETLKSVQEQTWFKTHDNWEIIVGVDGCNETLDYVLNNHINDRNTRVIMMNKNCGTYVTSNTIVKQTIFPKFIRFDSDDLMRENMVEKIMKCSNDVDSIEYKLKNFGKETTTLISEGSRMFKKKTFIKFGGYRNWRCSADSEIRKRLKNFIVTKTLPDVLFDRRVHNNSLTTGEGVMCNIIGKKGAERIKNQSFVTKLNPKTAKDATIEYTVSDYTMYSISNYTDVNKEHLIVTMTSWKKRISNIPTVIDTIFNNTKQPDKIVINLSSEEFPQKENELPSEVMEYINRHNKKIMINWVEGKNIKSWKKTIPTFKLFPFDAIICIDDDLLYPNNLIETLWEKHVKNPHNPITYAQVINHGFYQHCGQASLDKAEFYDENISDYLKTDITDCPDEDSFMTFMAARHGNPPVSCGSIFNQVTDYNNVNPISKPGTVNTAYKWIMEHLKETFEDYKNKPKPQPDTSKTPTTTTNEKLVAKKKYNHDFYSNLW